MDVVMNASILADYRSRISENGRRAGRLCIELYCGKGTPFEREQLTRYPFLLEPEDSDPASTLRFALPSTALPSLSENRKRRSRSGEPRPARPFHAGQSAIRRLCHDRGSVHEKFYRAASIVTVLFKAPAPD